MSISISVTIVKRIVILVILIGLLCPNVLFLFQPLYYDEQPILQNVLTFFSKETIVPIHAKYPTLYSYLISPFIAIGVLLNSIVGDDDGIWSTIGYLHRIDPLMLILPARLVSLAFLIGTGVVLSIFCWRRFGAFAGALVFVLLMASPAFLKRGSYALPDTGVLFFCALSLIYAAKFLENSDNVDLTRNILLSALFSGLAISMKYNALSSVVPIGFSIFYLNRSKVIGRRRTVALISASAVVCMLSFLAGSPGWLLKPDLFVSELMYEVEDAKGGHLGVTGIPVLGNIELLLVGDPIILVGSVLGFVFWLRDRERVGWIALVAVASSIALSATSSKQTLQYMYPALAGFLIFIGFMGRELARFNRIAVGLLVVLVLAVPVVDRYKRSLNILNEDTVALATRWMYEHIPTESTVAADWTYVPVLYSSQALDEIRRNESPRMSKEIDRRYRPYEVVSFTPSVDWLKHTDATYFITNDYVYRPFFNSGVFTGTVPPEDTELFEIFEGQKEFYEELLGSSAWEMVYSANTGNGPLLQIFRRRE